MSSLLPIAISMGDPCGIGPEIIAKIWAAGDGSGCLVVGDCAVLARAAAALPLRPQTRRPQVARIADPADIDQLPPGVMPVWQAEAIAPGSLDDLPPGRVDPRAGAAAHAPISF